MTPKRPRLVHVVWVDSVASDLGWTSPDEAGVTSKEPCETVGFLLRENADEVVVALSWSPNTEQVCSTMTIPRVAVRSIRPLRH